MKPYQHNLVTLQKVKKKLIAKKCKNRIYTSVFLVNKSGLLTYKLNDNTISSQGNVLFPNDKNDVQFVISACYRRDIILIAQISTLWLYGRSVLTYSIDFVLVFLLILLCTRNQAYYKLSVKYYKF